MTVEEFIASLAEKNIQLTEQQLAQFEQYYQLLIEWNEKINLTAITQKTEVYLKHFYDSLMPLWSTSIEFDQQHLCDVGAGAGFPSIPLKIVRPDLSITIIDSLQKRINFLNVVVEALNLENVQCLHGRAEDIGQNKAYRGQFDLVTARAVAPLNILCEYCMPLNKLSGYFLALKAQKTETELEQAKRAITTLGGQLVEQVASHLPGENSERHFILIKKTKETPNQYPRKAGKPAKNPIQ